MKSLIQDVRYAFRVLIKNPSLPALAVLTLALGITGTSTIFSWIGSTLLDPIPGAKQTRDLVTVMRGERTEHPAPPFSALDYRDLRDASHSFAGLPAYHHEYASLNEEFAGRYWPGQEAIGKRIKLYDRWRTVIGVVHNAKYRRVTYGDEPCFFVPWYQNYPPFDAIIVHVRVSGEPTAFALAIERAIHDLNPDLPVVNVTSIRESMQMGSLFERIVVTFAGSFGLLALALGAERKDILRLVLGQGLSMTMMGLALGWCSPWLRRGFFALTFWASLPQTS